MTAIFVALGVLLVAGIGMFVVGFRGQTTRNMSF